MLVRGGHVLDTAFAEVADSDPLPAKGAVAVSLPRFLKEREALLARKDALGVRLETTESPQALGSDVHNFALIVLHVPYFKDGRAFSWARLLRTRLGYKGEIRVTGHVLRDQIAFFARVGVDSFELRETLSPAEIESARAAISHVYQPSVDGQLTIRELRAMRAPAS
jgi:uncharacterized protein (DUF934 family)